MINPKFPVHISGSRSTVIDAPVAKTWEIIGSFHSLAWADTPSKPQASAHNDLPNSNRIGAVRELDLGGKTLYEELLEYSALTRSYAYTIVQPVTPGIFPHEFLHYQVSLSPFDRHCVSLFNLFFLCVPFLASGWSG